MSRLLIMGFYILDNPQTLGLDERVFTFKVTEGVGINIFFIKEKMYNATVRAGPLL